MKRKTTRKKVENKSKIEQQPAQDLSGNQVSEEITKKQQKTTKKSPAEKPLTLRERFFGKKHDKLTRDLKKMENLTKKQASREALRKRMFEEHIDAKQKKAPRKRYTFQILLTKAGISTPAPEFRKHVYVSATIFWVFASLVVLALAAYGGKTWQQVGLFLAGFWTAGFALFLIIVSLCVSTYLDFQIHERRKQLELVLPDYLQLVAANIDAGMTIDKALWFAVRPRFGVLAKEIENVAKRVLTGEDLSDALRDFAKGYDSPVLQRSLSLLLEGVAAGGKIADLLHKIAVDIQEQQILQKELAANVTTYVIFISFAAVGGAPILFGLSTQLLVVIKGIARNLGDSATSGSFLQITPDVISTSDFQTFSIAVLIISSVVSSMIIGVIRKGSAYESIRFMPVFVGASLVLYWGAVRMFGLLFSGFF